MAKRLPYQSDPIAEVGSLRTPNQWYLFFESLQKFVDANGGDSGVIADILGRLSALEAEGALTFQLLGPQSVKVTGLPQNGVVSVELAGDVDAPGNTYYYGTDETGAKGWFTLASAFTASQDGVELVIGSDGIIDIRPDDDLAAIEALTGTGFAARTADETWALRTWQNGPGIDFTNPGGVGGNPSATFNSHTAPVDRIAGSTYSTAQDFINTMHSPGTINGPALCIVQSGIPATPIRVLAGKGMIRVADDDVSSLSFFNWAQADFAQAADGLTRFYGVVYNAGAPVVQQRTTYNWDKDTEIPLGSAVVFASGEIVITPNPYKTGDPITNVIQRFDAQSPAIRDNSIGGLILGETGTRNATLTAGRIWSRLSDFDSVAKNSATTPMLSAFYNGSGLTVASGLTQWDNTRYNNMGTGALVAMGANKYANLWFFISIDGTKWGFAYGTAEYNTIGAAANEGVPAYLNQNFFQQALLLGRMIFQQGAATASLIESAFTQLFSTTAINNHNDLNGLQDAPNSVANQHYHLSSAQATTVSTLHSGGTTAQFWRGDGAWQNTLTGALNLNNLSLSETGGTANIASSRATGDVTINFGPMPQDGTGNALFRVGRFTNTTGRLSFDVCFGNNSSSLNHSLAGNQSSFLARTNGNLSVGTSTDNAAGKLQVNGNAVPTTDNVANLGTASFRWKEVFAGIGTINTSDAREKTERDKLTAEELAAASHLARDVSVFQWNEAIAEKGKDGARLHIGWIAQRVRDVMAAHGLDGFRYGFLCYDEWPEQQEVWHEWPAQDELVDPDTGAILQPAIEAGRELVRPYRAAGNLFGLRKDELMAFIIAAQEQRLQALEAKLAA